MQPLTGAAMQPLIAPVRPGQPNVWSQIGQPWTHKGGKGCGQGGVKGGAFPGGKAPARTSLARSLRMTAGASMRGGSRGKKPSPGSFASAFSIPQFATVDELGNRLEGACQTLCDKVMDLSIPEGQVRPAFAELMSLRAALLNRYMNGSSPGARDSQKAASRGSRTGEEQLPGLWAITAASQSGRVKGGDSKTKLHSECAKRAGRSPRKEDIVYTVTEVSPGMFLATVSGNDFLTTAYTNEVPVPSQKEAELAAAQIALETEFGDLPTAEKSQSSARKRGRMESVPAHLQDVKSRLQHLTQVLLGRALMKGDVTYQSSEEPDAGGNYNAKVSIPASGYFPSGMTFEGSAADKKEAERAAAKAGVDWLEGVCEPLQEEMKAKRAQKREERDKQREERDRKRLKTDEQAPF